MTEIKLPAIQPCPICKGPGTLIAEYNPHDCDGPRVECRGQAKAWPTPPGKRLRLVAIKGGREVVTAFRDYDETISKGAEFTSCGWDVGYEREGGVS